MTRTALAARAGGLLTVVLALVSCALDSLPSAPSADPIAAHQSWGDERSATGGLLKCRPLPYAADSALIGPRGGTLRIGRHVLRIPEGALASPVMIVGEAPADTVVSVRLSPEGLTFDEPVTLSLFYGGCRRPSTPLRIAYTTEALEILEWVPSSDEPDRARVRGRLTHFSRYAVGW